MDGKVLGIERRRRWSRDEKARIVEETLAPGAVVSEVARRHGVAQSLLFTWRRLARMAEPAGREGSILLPVEIDATSPPPEAARPARPATSGRRTRSGDVGRYFVCAGGAVFSRRGIAPSPDVSLVWKNADAATGCCETPPPTPCRRRSPTGR